MLAVRTGSPRLFSLKRPPGVQPGLFSQQGTATVPAAAADPGQVAGLGDGEPGAPPATRSRRLRSPSSAKERSRIDSIRFVRFWRLAIVKSQAR